MDAEARLRRADEHIFSTGLPDSGSRLGLANMRYGLAKIHWVQERLGRPANATFISAPDLTVTRNTNRTRTFLALREPTDPPNGYPLVSHHSMTTRRDVGPR